MERAFVHVEQIIKSEPHDSINLKVVSTRQMLLQLFRNNERVDREVRMDYTQAQHDCGSWIINRMRRNNGRGGQIVDDYFFDGHKLHFEFRGTRYIMDTLYAANKTCEDFAKSYNEIKHEGMPISKVNIRLGGYLISYERNNKVVTRKEGVFIGIGES